MKIKRIRIIQSGKPDYWYASQIGEEFFVYDEDQDGISGNPFAHRVIDLGESEISNDQPPCKRYIHDYDFDTLEELKGDVVQQITTFIRIKPSHHES